MRIPAILTTAFAMAIAVSFAAHSATEENKGPAKDVAVAPQPAPKDAMPQADMKGMEKMMQNKASAAKPKKLSAAQDRSKHFHPRDGK